MLGAICFSKATLFHWNFIYEQVNAAFSLESGCLQMWWYPDQMSMIGKYFAPFNFDKLWSILVVSIKASLPFDFAWVVCPWGIFLFNSQ